MRIGVVTKWFNRGQPVVGRHTRSALDQLGHETFVLARPKKERGPMPGALARDGVWDQPGVTEASAYDIPLAEYVAWIEDNGIEAIFCDQNYQFDELAELRRRGVLVIGRFVWEHFTAEHTEGVRRAYDLVFSMTRAEQERYRGMGLETPYVPWGCHPELIAVAREVRREPRETVTFVFPGGFLGHRKPLEPVLEAWSRVRSPRARLVVKAQVERRLEAAEHAAAADPRITLRIGDEPTPEHLRAVAACDVTLSPARWEGLGLPLYEAVAFGQPAITNATPPMDEIIQHERNGLLVPSRPDGTARSGITAHAFDVDAMAAAIDRLASDDELRERLAAAARELREGERAWQRTVDGFAALLEMAAA